MVYKNINWLSVNKNQIAKKYEINKKGVVKKYNTKTNKRISKSNSPQREMTVNEEWFIIPRELEEEYTLKSYLARSPSKSKPNFKRD